MSGRGAALRAGAAWGAIAGLVLALLLIRRHLHLHGGEMGVIFAGCILLGAAIGAGVGRLTSGGEQA